MPKNRTGVWKIPEKYASGVRGEILSHALNLFVERGFGSVSVSEIASAMGTSKQRVLYYYSSPMEVLVDLAVVWAAAGKDYTTEYLASELSPSAQEKLVAMAAATFGLLEEYPLMMRLFPILSEASAHNEEISRIYEGAMGGGVNRIVGIVSKIPEVKQFSGRRIEQLAKAIHFIMLGGVYYSLSSRNIQISVFKRDVIQILKSYLESVSNAKNG